MLPSFYNYYGDLKNLETGATVCRFKKDISDFECSLIVESPNLYKLLVESLPHIKDIATKCKIENLLTFITCNHQDDK
jgi:hypothetical protein